MKPVPDGAPLPPEVLPPHETIEAVGALRGKGGVSREEFSKARASRSAATAVHAHTPRGDRAVGAWPTRQRPGDDRRLL